eukprot:scaffold14488_cov131-Isochrysis_galbana.AAC.8
MCVLPSVANLRVNLSANSLFVKRSAVSCRWLVQRVGSMPATLVTAAQRTGFARQRNNAVTLAAMLVPGDDGESGTPPNCACS